MAIEEKLNQKQGHWALAKAGKKILRPGGLELTHIMIDQMQISKEDDVVEFAPGLGYTAAITCKKKPKSYTGIDRNKEAASLAQQKANYPHMQMILADAAETTLPDQFATKVYGEAMLTMQPLEHKIAIIKEAARILKPGGYYGIHEMGLQPDNINEEVRNSIHKELSANMRVHARPLTVEQWKGLLEDQGFEIVSVKCNAMALLEPKRMIADEGFFQAVRIFFNMMTHKDIRERSSKMRKSFRKYKNEINAIAIVARKK